MGLPEVGAESNILVVVIIFLFIIFGFIIWWRWLRQ
jgi:hypothetical protein